MILQLVGFGACKIQDVTPISAQLRQRLHTVTAANGISKLEARTICECYFAKHLVCGGFPGLHDGGDRWIVDAAFGYSGEPVSGFYIYEHSGKVVSPIGPSYDNPIEIFS